MAGEMFADKVFDFEFTELRGKCIYDFCNFCANKSCFQKKVKITKNVKDSRSQNREVINESIRKKTTPKKSLWD